MNKFNVKKIMEELIKTIENNAVDNTAIITNVSLWAESWRKEIKHNKDILKEKKTFLKPSYNINQLDCPYDFTSRCTMGRCDCKEK